MRVPILDAQIPGVVLFIAFMVVLLAVSGALLWAGMHRSRDRPSNRPR